ncbi:MAG: alcohol dehydrogenase catalytic domain-containing protein [Phycisphaerae bacterium]|jgi:threonine dehydrogenase-like Zn-dependent dehydrogenase
MTFPKTQKAVQLIGASELKLNENKEVFVPNDYQILAEVQAVGLCFSDLKLLKQFTGHVRKSEVVSGADQSILKEIPSYVPNEKPAVPGHEAVVKVTAVGKKVQNVKVGQRFLVQADYRWLKTANSNGAFGYNFEGALQQYILVDSRVIVSPEGQSTLIPATDKLSASAVALVEPWACVEQAYAVKERTTLKKGGQMLVVSDAPIDKTKIEAFADKFGKPAKIIFSKDSAVDGQFDDVIYFGSNAATAEALFSKVATNGLFNIVLCSGKFDRKVSTQVGRVHYGNIRIIGTTGSDPAEAMANIPATAEIRKGNNVNVIGAGGPMGVMHVVRNVCQGVANTTVYAGDLDDVRLAALEKTAKPLADKNKVGLKFYNPSKSAPQIKFDYFAVMAPVPKLVAAAVESSAEYGIINIFAGIPATVNGDIDLNAYIEKHIYLIGTSGSTIDDMITILKKVEAGSLDTNVSVGAICGIEHAIDGIKAVEAQSISGKILVYPWCENLPLTKLENLKDVRPDVAKALDNGIWCKRAEDTLLKGSK